MEISSGYLKQRNLEQELDYIIRFMAVHSTSATYMYGWGCEISIDDQWTTYPVEVRDIKVKVKASIDKQIFKYGESDLYISDSEEKFYFLLCHEGDVHFRSDDEALVAAVNESWRHKGYQTHKIKRQV